MAEAARLIEEIVEEHFRIEPGLRQIAVYSEGDAPEIRLIEVNEDTLPSGEVEPFLFAPTPDMELPVYIADVTPEEWKEIEEGTIAPPRGWPARPVRIVPRPRRQAA